VKGEGEERGDKRKGKRSERDGKGHELAPSKWGPGSATEKEC